MKSDIELRVVDLSRGGAGVAREPGGRVIFIPYTAPGDRVRVRITEEDKRYAQAELLEILEASPIRQTPPCLAFSKCGGCQWQHLPYELQWETKTKGVLHALERVGVALPVMVDQIPASQIWEYRNRIQLRGNGTQMGFFKPGSRELVPVDRCWIARTEINQGWEQTRLEGSNLSKPYKVEVEVFPRGELKRTWNARHAAGGFRQVHDEQNKRLIDWISQEIRESDVLYDLFGGAGNLSLPLLGKMKEVHCVDLSAPKQSPPGTPANMNFHRKPVVPWLQERLGAQKSESVNKISSAILDPPREGLAGEFSFIANALEVLNVRQLVAVGCDVDAWARDVSRWVKKRWQLGKIMMIDLFPQTSHVESVALLFR